MFCDIYLFIYSCFAAICVFYFFFIIVLLFLHTPDAWWTVKDAAVVGDDISGVCSWYLVVFSKRWLFFALHFFCSSLMNGFKNRNSLAFFSCKWSLLRFNWLCWCSVSGKIRNDYRLFIKNCMTLFVLCRTRDFQTLLPILCTLAVAWVTSCFDNCGAFLNSSSALLTFNHIILYLWDGCIFTGSCFFLFLHGYSGTFKWKTAKRVVFSQIACRYCNHRHHIITRSRLASWAHWFVLMSGVACLQSAVHTDIR